VTAPQPRTKCPDFIGQNVRSGSIGFWKPDAERAPATDFTFRRDLTTLALDQCLTYGKTKAGSLAALRREEGIEYFLHNVRVYANSGVDHLDDNAGNPMPEFVEPIIVPGNRTP
jgi:hypothetical protein